MTPAIVWFRNDLRLEDNPALGAAVRQGGPVIPVYILDDEGEGRWKPGEASRWWLHHALAALGASLDERGSRLTLARGDSLSALRAIAKASGACAVFWNRRYEPLVAARDRRVREALLESGIEVAESNSALLFEPWEVSKKDGGAFQVFTAYWRRCLELPIPEPVPTPRGNIPRPVTWPATVQIGDLGLLPRIRWDTGLAEAWEPGEASGARRLRQFTRNAMEAYATGRDLPDLDGTSRLSPWLHFGEIGPRQVVRAIREISGDSGVFPPSNGARVFLSELGWREFAHHLLHHFPGTPERPLRPEFSRFPWASDPNGRLFKAWSRGATGYPIVDAGMRQLWRTGWMHNRVRMIAASFLVKHLRLPWNLGADWFWNTLVDADLGNNTLGWQWTAGCGADAAPYFRIFAPVRQGQRFDPDGAYVRRWVPEIAGLSDAFIHNPWEAPSDVLGTAGIRLGATYPAPLVDHSTARVAALEAFKSLRSFRVA